MIVLALDTCDPMGGVALLRDQDALSSATHNSAEDYSTWLLPAVDIVLKEAGISMKEVDAYAVAAGPGSFTGVRVGLTTVKAWNEVYGTPIAAVSRLEALAGYSPNGTSIVAACADGRRGQVFGAVYQRERTRLTRLGDEMVLAPGTFLGAVAELAKGERIAWVMTNADLVVNEEVWKSRTSLNEPIEAVTGMLTMAIGRIGARQIQAGHQTDALALDANYLRREDAKSVWKDGPRSGH